MSEEVNKKDKIADSKKKNNFKSLILFSILLLSVLFFTPYANGFDIKELLPVKHNVFVKGPNMHVYHNGPAVLMNDGNVLVIGGDTKKAEIYDYKKNKFVYANGEMKYKRDYGASSITLKNGNVLITGGAYNIYNDNKQIIKKVFAENAEIYNPKTQSFSEINKILIPRTDHTSILMDNGNVLLCGGRDKLTKPVFEIEEFNYKNNSFKKIFTIDITDFYWKYTFKIDKNNILIIGNNIKKNIDKIDAYIFNYEKKQLTHLNLEASNNNLKQNIMNKMYVTSLPLLYSHLDFDTQNRIIFIKYNQNTIYNIFYNNQIKQIQGKYFSYTSTKLNDNTAIFIGGYILKGWGGSKSISDSFFILNDGSIIKNKSKLNEPRAYHQAISLNNGNILILGGIGNKIKNNSLLLLSTEIYYK